MKTKATILALALAIAFMQSAPAQTFKKVHVNLNTPVVQVASGGKSVWALASNGNPYIFNGTGFVLANTISLSQIKVGGGSAAQADEVWGLDPSGNIYRASKSGTSWIFSPIPGSLSVVEVGLGYQDKCHPYEVWGLNSGAQIFRYNYCLSNWEQLPGVLCDIKVGGGDIWGAQCGPNVFRFNFSTSAFDLMSSPFVAFPVLTVGPNGEVWAQDTGSGKVYKFDGFSAFANFGCCVNQVAAGGNGIWILDGTDVYRYEPNTQTFVQVIGASLTSLSVGSGGGVWGINSLHQVFKFSTP